MKKILSLIIASILLFAISIPCSADSLSSDPDSLNLTIEDAYKLLETDNTELKLMNKQIAYNEDHTSELTKNSENVKNKVSKVEIENIALRKQELLNWKRAQYDLDNLRHDKSEKLYNLKIELKKQYMDVFKLREDIQNAENEVTVLGEKINNAKVSISLGQARDIDLKQLETQKEEVINNMNLSKKQENQNLLDIKQTLNIPLDKKINIIPFKTEFTAFDDKDIDNRMNSAIDKDYDINKKKRDLDLTELEYMIIMQYTSGPKTDEANSLELSIGEKKNDIEDAKTNLKTSLLNSYHSLKNLEYSVKVEKLNLEIAETNLKITESNVETGQVPLIQQKSDRLTVDKEKTAVQKAINDYTNATEDFRHLLSE